MPRQKDNLWKTDHKYKIKEFIQINMDWDS